LVGLYRSSQLVIGLFISLLLMSACGTSTDTLPTVASLPTVVDMVDTPEPVVVADNDVSAEATLPATWTPTVTESVTPSPTVTETYTVTPSLTITDTPTVTYTPSASPTQIPRPIGDLIQLAYSATILPTDFQVPFREGIEVTLGPDAGLDDSAPTPTANTTNSTGNSGVIVIATADTGQAQYDASVDCPFYPVGGFATAYTSDPVTAQLLGCPSGNPPNTTQVQTAYQVFERGAMLWVAGSPNQIYALYNDGTYQRFGDTFTDGVDPESGGEIPPEGLLEPTRGFGKVWRNNNAVKGFLGWAVSPEIADSATQQLFVRGAMLYIPLRGDVLALMTNPDGGTGTWKPLPGSF